MNYLAFTKEMERQDQKISVSESELRIARMGQVKIQKAFGRSVRQFVHRSNFTDKTLFLAQPNAGGLALWEIQKCMRGVDIDMGTQVNTAQRIQLFIGSYEE